MEKNVSKDQKKSKRTRWRQVMIPPSHPLLSRTIPNLSQFILLYTLMTRDSWPRKHKTWQDSLLTTNGYVCQNWRQYSTCFFTFNKNIPPNDLYERTLFFKLFILFLLLRLSFLFITFFPTSLLCQPITKLSMKHIYFQHYILKHLFLLWLLLLKEYD